MRFSSILQPPVVISEPLELEPTPLQRRIILSFCATVLAGIALCALYLAGAVKERTEFVVISLPDPPPPASVASFADRGGENPVIQRNPLKLEVVATQDSWVEVDTDGHNKYRKLVRVEESLSFEASQRIRMMTGNAPGLELRFNGKPVAGVGPKRRVRTLEFTSQGVLEVNSSTS